MTNLTADWNESGLLKGEPAPGGEKAASAAALATSTGALVACSACCVLPVALPAVALALGATTLSWVEAAHGWLTIGAVVMLLAAWGLVWRQSARSGRRTARATILMLGVATVLTGVALAWPWLEPGLVALFR